uniref:Knottin scorpion toxin-like domain-containing protein n=1 Tax=Oryza punctata TaxID=4537 RepID=A0A0E0K5V0_ORYPU
MKAIHAALLILAIVLVASPAASLNEMAGVTAQVETCTEVINREYPTCDSGLCVANCQRQYRGGIGQCVGNKCKCDYSCAFLPPPPPAASN